VRSRSVFVALESKCQFREQTNSLTIISQVPTDSKLKDSPQVETDCLDESWTFSADATKLGATEEGSDLIEDGCEGEGQKDNQWKLKQLWYFGI